MAPLILSSDSHVFEPPDLWQTRIDRAFRDRAPRIELGQGRERVKAFLREHPDVSDAIVARIQTELGTEQVASARLLPAANGGAQNGAAPDPEPETAEAAKA